MKVLVTGATGYIGAHLVKSLAEWGHLVYATDYNLQQNDISRYVTSDVFEWDITEPSYLGDFDAVVHLAAKTMVSKSMLDPLLYYKTNILGTQNVINAAPCDHFVYCSTGSAFNPGTSPYATSKRAGEDLASILPSYSITRFYNVSGNDGMRKFEDGYMHLIRKAAAVANRKFDKLEIFGTDWETRDGTTIRNYTHVKDIVDATVALVEHGPTNSIECFGSPTGHTVRDVVSAMKSVSWDFSCVDANRRPGEVAVSTVPTKSRFFTETKSLEELCTSALEYER